MKYFVYNYFDVNLKVFDAPIITTEAPDVFVEKVKRTLKTVKPFDYQFQNHKIKLNESVNDVFLHRIPYNQNT